MCRLAIHNATDRPWRAAQLTGALVVPISICLTSWAQGDANAPTSGGDDGRRVFMQGTEPPCAACHALSDAGATGNIGPDLDELKADATRVRRAVKEGFGNMPAFGESLSDAQINAVAQYVARATGAQ